MKILFSKLYSIQNSDEPEQEGQQASQNTHQKTDKSEGLTSRPVRCKNGDIRK